MDLLPSIIKSGGYLATRIQIPDPDLLEFNRIQDEINNVTQIMIRQQDHRQQRLLRNQETILRVQLDAIHRRIAIREEYEQEINRRCKNNNLPINKIKQSIQASHKRISLSLIDKLSDEELEEALVYLDRINSYTPKNKTRPIIRDAIINKLTNETDYVLK